MSAVAGLTTVVTLGWILNQLAGWTSALCGMFIWAAMPFAVFHERLALQDPFVTALLVGSIALVTAGTMKPRQRRDWVWFVSAGILFGVAFLQKISAALALPWLAIVYLAIRQHAARPLFDRQMGLIAIGTVLPIASLGSGIFLLGTKLENYEALSLTRHTDFFTAFIARIQIWIDYYSDYGRWPLFLSATAALILAGCTKNRLALACAVGWFAAFVVTGIFYNNTFARYALSDQLPLVLFLALSIGNLLGMKPAVNILIAFVGLFSVTRWACISWQIGTNPRQAAISHREIAQYFTGPWSGNELGDVKTFLQEYARQNHVTCTVLTHPFSRAGCYGLMLAGLADPQLEVIPYLIYLPGELAAARPILQRMATERPRAFFILYEGSLYPASAWLDFPSAPTHRVVVTQSEGKERFILYQFTP
jgi:hypothetical protein